MISILQKSFLEISISFIIICQIASSEKQLPYLLKAQTSTQCGSLLNRNNSDVRDAVNMYLLEKGVPSPCPCLNSTQWMQAAYLDMTDPSQQCPSNWSLNTAQVRGCSLTRTGAGCDSVYYSAEGLSYNRVCGRILGYQRGSHDAFDFMHYSEARGLEGVYADGLSLTHGSPGSRQHIWTFAVGFGETSQPSLSVTCGCSNTNFEYPYELPSFIGNNYFCETGNIIPTHSLNSDDPLWDGQGCGPTSTCCQKNNPPWFCAALPQMTSDDLELRICTDEGKANEDTVVSHIELYVAIEQSD